MRNRHIPRLCDACGAPFGSQDNTCWRCGRRWAGRRARQVEGQGRLDTERWADEGGGLERVGAASPGRHAELPTG
jgi:hypothetical protein